jgi:phosphotriesterase-related protein
MPSTIGFAGADISRVVISHIDRAVRNPKNRNELAKTGYYLEYYLFGREGYYPPHWRVIDLPNDHQRLNEISQLTDEGYLNQILISHGIISKTRLCTYGGWGYAYILRDTASYMRLKGFSDEVIRSIIVDNPKRLMTFA